MDQKSLNENNEQYILKARMKNSGPYVNWCQAEDDMLSKLCELGDTIPSIAKLLKRSDNDIEARIKHLGITREENIKLENTRKNQVYQIIRYWRNSLADMEKMGLSPSKMKQGERFETHIFKNAQLPLNKIQKFFDKAEVESKKRWISNQQKITKEEPCINTLQVIIAPYTIHKHYEHGKKINDKSPDEVFPLWLVADVTREGKLVLSSENIYPWIERRCLTPNENYVNYPIIGDIAQVDNFYRQKKDLFSSGKLNWENLFLFAEELFFSILNKGDNILPSQNYSLSNAGYILSAREVFEASKNIITTYDQYLFDKNKKIPPLLEELCSLKENGYFKDKAIEELFIASQYHLGQMENRHPLSESQRIALSYLCDHENNNIFTINGPPGTGKTSLLLSIIASRWVESAIQKKPPSILVAASTNNLAVTNILNHFKQKINFDSTGESTRWLPDFNSYGLYLAPTNKAKECEERGYLYRLKEKGSGSIEKLYTQDYQLHAKDYFLKQFNDYYQRSDVDILCCQEFLHNLLIEKQAFMKKVINSVHELYIAQKDIKHRFGSIEELNDVIFKKTSQKKLLETQLNEIIELQASWFSYKTTHIGWLRLLAWLPSVRSLLVDKVKLFTSKHHHFFSENLSHIDLADDVFSEKIKQSKLELQTIDAYLKELTLSKNAHEQFIKNKMLLDKQLGFEFSIDHLFDFANNDNLLCKIDTTLRYDLFLLATHYWEAGWLLECEMMKSLVSAYSAEDRKKYWEIQAMLTPCFVTTLHSGPGFFQHKTSAQHFDTLDNFIDLLIIDEAGQVMPAIAGAMISTAKKVLLVGDTQQIEPIFSLTEGIDLANAKKFGLCIDEREYEALKNKGILCSGNSTNGNSYGNLIVVGQRKSKYHLKEQKYPGMMLKEHRRCAKEIISYCNELCYNNQLLLMAEEKTCCFPRMGYAHVKGREERLGTSRFNKHEAETIAAWIVKNQNKILTSCDAKTLDECLGIVTPFAVQANAIRSALHKYNLYLKTVGTIHSLQGGEKDIIIFSPVYTAAENQGTFFFDKSPNMLNVAVSRAKTAFIVFGDIDIFDPRKGNQPSSVLAKYLLSHEENEITDIIQTKFRKIADHEIEQINSLVRHREILAESFVRTNKELNIVSPFLRIKAIESDAICDRINKYSSKIVINIYTDPTLNKGHFNEFKNAKEILTNAGANVILVNRVHSKIITIDDRIIVEGSFNWLSASRHEGFDREECSIIYTGKHVSRFILEAIEPLRRKMLC
jgi:hypothetical protein